MSDYSFDSPSDLLVHLVVERLSKTDPCLAKAVEGCVLRWFWKEGQAELDAGDRTQEVVDLLWKPDNRKAVQEALEWVLRREVGLSLILPARMFPDLVDEAINHTKNALAWLQDIKAGGPPGLMSAEESLHLAQTAVRNLRDQPFKTR